MIDSHCHLDLPAFADDWQDVIRRAQQAGVTRLLIPGTTPEGWHRQRLLATQCDCLDVAFGLHPYFFPADHNAALDALQQQLEDPGIRPVAVGEIGIDCALDIPVVQQQAVFEAQLALASAHQLPVILHHRRSHHLLLESIKRCRFNGGGVVHAFSGSKQVADQYIEAGFMLGVGGTITYPRAAKTRATVTAVDMQYLLLETDAPDMPMAGRQGQRNSPEYLADVVDALAALKGYSINEVAQQTSQNYARLFALRTHCR